MDRCLDEAKRMNAGITFNVALMDASGFAATTNFPTWRMFDQVVDGALQRGLPKIRIIVGGGPPPHRTWKDLNHGESWTMPNRPPRGEDDALWRKLVEYKQALIDGAVAKAKNRKLDPKSVLEIQLWTEPGKGGSGGPWVSANPYRYQGSNNRDAEGTWDDTLHEQLNFEASNLNFQGLTVFAPSFEFQSRESFGVELITAGRTVGQTWRSKVDVWPVSVYAGAVDEFDQATAVSRFATKAGDARRMIRDRLGDRVRVAISEYGWTNTQLKSSDEQRGRALADCEREAASLGFESACLYTLVDDPGVVGYGVLSQDFRRRDCLESFLAAARL